MGIIAKGGDKCLDLIKSFKLQEKINEIDEKAKNINDKDQDNSEQGSNTDLNFGPPIGKAPNTQDIKERKARIAEIVTTINNNLQDEELKKKLMESIIKVKNIIDKEFYYDRQEGSSLQDPSPYCNTADGASVNSSSSNASI